MSIELERTPRTSDFLPPWLREQLVAAGNSGAIDRIDYLTDLAAQAYPHLVLARTTCRPEFVPAGLR